jgi:hypothetical protein
MKFIRRFRPAIVRFLYRTGGQVNKKNGDIPDDAPARHTVNAA